MRKARGQIDQLDGFFHIENSLRSNADHFTRDEAKEHRTLMFELAEAYHLKVVFWHFYATGFGILAYKEEPASKTVEEEKRLTEFIKRLKQQITVTHNRETGHSGTIWKDRSKLFHVPDTTEIKCVVAAYIIARSEIETGQTCLDWPSSLDAAQRDRFEARRSLNMLFGKARYSTSLLKTLESTRSQILEECAKTRNSSSRGPNPEWRPVCERGPDANSRVSSAPSSAYRAQRKRAKKRFFEMLSRYQNFCKKTGFKGIARGYQEEPELRKWAAGLRGANRSGRLPGWKHDALKGTSVLEPIHVRNGKPAPPNDAWLQRFHSLQEFHKSHGHCRVKHRDPANKTLANWVWTQRGLARKNKLHPEKRRLLNKLGFDWNPKKTGRA